MDFCYLHPTVEAQGKCLRCGNFICEKDYRIMSEMTSTGTNPVIYCVICFDRMHGIDPAREPSISMVNPNKFFSVKKVLMCNQCGEKISFDDNFCPNCGDPTDDEFYDATHPIDGVRSAKKLR